MSICIPTVSVARLRYLHEALAFSRAQTHYEIEIVVSDDSEETEIDRFVHQAARTDSRVRYRRNERRLGLGGNWNALVHDARGHYLVIIGDDDRLLPNFIESLLEARRNHDPAVIFSNHYVIDSDGFRDEKLTALFTRRYFRDRIPPGLLVDPVSAVWRNAVPMLASLIRTADARRLGINTDLNTPEIELFARLAAEGQSFVFVPQYLAEYRIHPASQTSEGLAGERLIPYLDPIAVPAHVEPLKRTFMAELLTSAVNKAVRNGDLTTARALTRHRYYPALHDKPAHVLAQKTLTRLPLPLSRWTLSAIEGALRRLRRFGSLRADP